MAIKSIDELYEHYIKPLPPAKRLQLVELIARDMSQTDTPEPPRERSLLELEGLGQEIWEGIDAQEYVNELRKEWDHRP